MRHQQAFRNMRSLRSSSQVFLGLGLLSILIVGCGQPLDLEALEAEDAAPSFEAEFPSDPEFGLLNDGATVKVGEPVQSALDAFPRPEGAYDFNSPPADFEEEFAAAGWEHRKMGFAVMHKNSVVVSAMWREKGITSDDITRLVRRYENRFGEPHQMVPSTAREVQEIQYWFWQVGTERLCLVSTIDHQGELAFVAAVGRTDVMDALRMNPGDAREDVEKAIELLKDSEGNSEQP